MSDLNPDLTPTEGPDLTTEQELEAFFASASAEPGQEPDVIADPEPEGQPGDGDATPPTPERVSVLGRDLGNTEAQSLLDFYDWVRANPRQAMAIDAYMQGQADFVVQGQQQPQQQAPAPPEPDEEWEALPESVKSKLAEIDDMKRSLQVTEQDRAMQQQAMAQAAVARGSANFAEKYGLNDEEVEELQRDTAALGILPGLAAQRGDMLVAMEEALDIAYWRNEKFRDRQMAAYQKQQTETQRRQRKASSVSGGSGSMPRVPDNVDTSTAEGRRQAMVAMIAAAQNGNQT